MDAVAGALLFCVESTSLASVEQVPRGWSVEGAKLVRRIELDDYWKVVVASLAISLLAIWRDHHPTLIVEFRSLVVELFSHDVGAITDRDLELARLINGVIPPRAMGQDGQVGEEPVGPPRTAQF